jgi:hypothetical protein
MSDDESPLAVYMAADEQACLAMLLRSANSYVEFGCGGSTVLASTLVAHSIIACDSSLAWLDRVALACRSTAAKVQPRLIHANIGPTGEWGRPTDESCKDRWPLYSTAVWATEGANSADLYLVDGRFRVACFIETMMRCRPDAVVAIHDYAPRDEYHIVENFARPFLACSTLSAFIRRGDFDRLKAAEVLARFRYMPG